MTALRSRAEAVATLRSLREDALAGRATTSVPLDALAGRTLAADVVAEDPRPRHNYATMDGFAVDAGDDAPRSVRDAALTPDDDPVDHVPGTATPVATGAPLPRGANAVIPREDAVRDGQTVDSSPLDAWTNVVRRGSTCAAGERLFEAGTVLAPRDAALLRDVGRSSVPVATRFSVGVLATGDEVDAGTQPDRDSEALAGLVRRWSHEPTVEGTVPDDRTAVADRLREVASDHDVVLTSGGTSVGHGDVTVDALTSLGTLVWQGVALRPGRPVACVRLDDFDAVAFALPGKPVAAHTAAVAVLAPFFRGREATATRPATMADSLTLPDAPVEYAVPVALDDGVATPFGAPASPVHLYDGRYRPGRVAACPRVLRADGLVVAPSSLDAGERVDVVPYPELEGA
ncbi:MAG: molybdopterin molybdotransferase MoeA [Haloplanus sp.]